MWLHGRRSVPHRLYDKWLLVHSERREEPGLEEGCGWPQNANHPLETKSTQKRESFYFIIIFHHHTSTDHALSIIINIIIIIKMESDSLVG
jgi:hypothetical protein